MTPYLYDYGINFTEYLAGFELTSNPLDLLGVYVTCVLYITSDYCNRVTGVDTQHNELYDITY